jgi:uncharacterized protein involved in exopolysaccharide biosynthesis
MPSDAPIDPPGCRPLALRSHRAVPRLPGAAAWVIIAAASLAGCTEQALVKRLEAMELRVARLEAQVAELTAVHRPGTSEMTDVPSPYRSREEILGQIERLQTQRARLLTKYTPQHPNVVDLDRQIRLLQRQLAAMER